MLGLPSISHHLEELLKTTPSLPQFLTPVNGCGRHFGPDVVKRGPGCDTDKEEVCLSGLNSRTCFVCPFHSGIEPGHIPGSVSIPFTDFLTESGLEKSPEKISSLFQEKKVDLAKPLVATCGSGVTACHVALGAYLCGKPDVAIYDGAWVEWFMRARPEHIISESRGKKAP